MCQVCQHGLERLVCLDGHDAARMRQHAKRQRADARTHLKHPTGAIKPGKVKDIGDDMVIYQEVLPKAMLGGKAKALEHLARGRGVRKR